MTHFNLSDTDIRNISEIIVGDAGSFYPYIPGPKIVETFNTEFGLMTPTSGETLRQDGVMPRKRFDFFSPPNTLMSFSRICYPTGS